MGLFSFLFSPKKPVFRSSSVFSCPHSSSYVILDTETTGLSPTQDKIIQLSAIKYDPTGHPIDFYNTYLNPGCHIPDKVSYINGITDKMVENAPSPEQIRSDFLKFIEDALIVGYNTKFDLKFLNNTFASSLKKRVYVDVLSIARKTISIQNYKLETVASHMGYKPASSFHDSFTDCEAVAFILNRTKEDLDWWIELFQDDKEYPKKNDRAEIILSKGYEYWRKGEDERISGNLEKAFQLFDMALEADYIYPFVYESYAKAYRKLKDYENEIPILNEAIYRIPASEIGSLAARKSRAEELMLAAKKKEEYNLQKALIREQKAVQRKEKEELKSIQHKSCKRKICKCADDGTILEVFESIAAASKEVGISTKCIRDAANGKQKHAGGVCWKYDSIDDYAEILKSDDTSDNNSN